MRVICEHGGSILAHLVSVVKGSLGARFKPAQRMSLREVLPQKRTRNDIKPLALEFLEDQAGVLAPEAEAVGKGHIYILYPGYIGYIV